MQDRNSEERKHSEIWDIKNKTLLSIHKHWFCIDTKLAYKILKQLIVKAKEEKLLGNDLESVRMFDIQSKVQKLENQESTSLDHIDA